jgi:hypothetical protein
MIQKTSSSPNRRRLPQYLALLLAQCLALLLAATFLTACPAAGPPVKHAAPPAPAPLGSGPVFFGSNASQVPNDLVVPTGSSPEQALTLLSTFAWQEFIALNWLSTYNTTSFTRGEPDTHVTPLQFTQLGTQPLVWQTYMHRVEIFPLGVTQDGVTTYPNYPTSFNTPPQYFYTGVAGGQILPCGGGSPPLSGLTTYFNNLDETSEISLATLFVQGDPNAPGAPPPASSPFYSGLPGQPRRFIYQAKANATMFNYILANKLYDSSTRKQVLGSTYTAVNQQGLGGIAPCPTAGILCFPPGQLNPPVQGMMEVKATWRQLTLTEYQSGRYVTAPVVRYSNPNPATPSTYCYEVIPGTPTSTTLPYGLVGLHIIHKTTNFPTFIFATFEQVDNLDQSKPDNQIFFYNNNNNGIVNPGQQYVTTRSHPVPPQVLAVNQQVQAQLHQLLQGSPFKDSVWAYYQLVGVQGEASNYAENNDFFLANIATETNEALSSFSGTLSANGTINSTQADIHQGTTTFIGGGCKGCHGNAQIGNAQTQQASDFSFITLKAPFGAPDAINQPISMSSSPWPLGAPAPKAAATTKAAQAAGGRP